MKMPQNIIEKFDLVGSTAQIGRAFVNDLKIFTSNRPDLSGILFMECDVNGEDNGSINIHITNRLTCKTPPELLDKIPSNQLIHYINNWMVD